MLVHIAGHTLAVNPTVGKDLAKGIKDLLDELLAPCVPTPAVRPHPDQLASAI